MISVSGKMQMDFSYSGKFNKNLNSRKIEQKTIFKRCFK